MLIEKLHTFTPDPRVVVPNSRLNDELRYGTELPVYRFNHRISMNGWRARDECIDQLAIDWFVTIVVCHLIVGILVTSKNLNWNLAK